MSEQFRVYAALEAFEKAGDEHEMRIGGLVTTDSLDRQDERVVQEGLDFSPFLKEGWYNDNHGQKTTDVVGYPTGAKYVRKGERLPSGKRAETNGWWAEGYLLNTDEGRKLWSLCRALQKGPRRLGFSIEGKVKGRDKSNSSVITRAIVKNVAVTHCPVNTDTEMVALAKALTAGSAINNPGSAPGEGFALRQESLDKAPYGQQGSPDNAWDAGAHEHQDPKDTANLAGGDGDDPNDGGWAGMNPHTTPVKRPADALPPGHMAKADEIDLTPMSEADYMASWADTLAAANRAMGEAARSDRLTKAEARIIVRSRLPHLSAEEVDALIEH